jgi:UDP:flavonoid glycosyltransferase YjiC (YdhE family)
VLEREKHGVRVALPWPDEDPTPFVLVSFSTAPEQGSAAKFQNAIDALAALPVHGVVTVGDSVDPTTLKPGKNVVVFATADHDDLIRRASLVVTHSGHGTLMRALTHGLPLVVIPGMAHDQAPTPRRRRPGASDARCPADAEAMRGAVQVVLASSACRENAEAISRQLAGGVDGARNAATEIEALL